MSHELSEVLAKFSGARVLVAGDLMLDRFVYGRANRISPEAPIPVLTVEREIAMLGGAGNVARNIASLGGEAVLVGLVGKDGTGDTLRALVDAERGVCGALLSSADRPTTEKTRYIAERQQILRADREMSGAARDHAPELLQVFRRHLDACDAVIFSDYAKGVLCDEFIVPALAAARAAGKPVVVDPKSGNLARYAGATIVTPNSDEAATATGVPIDGDAAAAAAARTILEAVPGLRNVLVTRGADGMTLASGAAEALHIRGRAREVFDVSGAGDTVVAALTLGLAVGADVATAAKLANIAAGIAVAAVGTTAVGTEELEAELQGQRIHSSETKIVSLTAASKAVEHWRARGERVGFTNGCFDLIHPGHVSLLAQARAECDRLVVGLNTDASVKRLKGADRPIQDETARAIVLASFAAVDLVVRFDEDTPEHLIRTLRPDVLIKGADYTMDQVVGADFVSSYGGKVIRAALTPDTSTSRIISRIPKKAGQ